jgi:hypothetical protein
MANGGAHVADSTAAVKSTAQSQTGPFIRRADAFTDGPSGEGQRFSIAENVTRAVRGRPYERREGEPLYRPLRVYTLDPAASALEGKVTVVNVPYEQLEPGPAGAVLAVLDEDEEHRNVPVNLDSASNLLTSGRAASPTDPQFRQQMIYAVGSLVYSVFRTALGRPVAWGFPERTSTILPKSQLILRPHGRADRNAFYDKSSGEIRFGFFVADEEVLGRNLPRGPVFTCLSHDIVAHEMTHALIDGIRTHFTVPSNPEVLAFHEAIADLVAHLQRFSYKQVVSAALRQSAGRLDSKLLIHLAGQFAETTGLGESLRQALDIGLNPEEIRKRRESTEPHIRSQLLVAAIFDALNTIYGRKIERYLRLATNGSGLLPPGDLNPDLLEVLAKQASTLASQFLSICIRAIDYCPPVDIQFGEYLRALITADRALVPDDPYNYREALIDAFRIRGLYPSDVDSLSEDSLLWREPVRAVPPWPRLAFAELRFRGDPGDAADADELHRQASEIGKLATHPHYHDLFGLVDPAAPHAQDRGISLPSVESVRSTRRVGPDGQVVFDLVAEVIQHRKVRTPDGGILDFYGGSTIIVAPDGRVRYTINKRLSHHVRERKQVEYVSGPGRKFWERTATEWKPSPLALCAVHSDRLSRVKLSCGIPES